MLLCLVTSPCQTTSPSAGMGTSEKPLIRRTATPQAGLSVKKFNFKLSSDHFTPVGWGYIGDEILPTCVGIIINHYKDPYQPSSIVECHKGIVHAAQGIGVIFS